MFLPGQNLQHSPGTVNCSDFSQGSGGQVVFGSARVHCMFPSWHTHSAHSFGTKRSPCSYRVCFRRHCPEIVKKTIIYETKSRIATQLRLWLKYLRKHVGQHSPGCKTGFLHSTRSHSTGLHVISPCWKFLISRQLYSYVKRYITTFPLGMVPKSRKVVKDCLARKCYT